VENAAIALTEAPDLIMRPGRLCSNGKPAPVDRPDFVKYAQALREAARATLKAAREKNQEKVSDLTNNIADACVSCHTVYRNTPPGGERRCVP
jgi:cytochrome c553